MSKMSARMSRVEHLDLPALRLTARVATAKTGRRIVRLAS
jgi:hypothetical protein